MFTGMTDWNGSRGTRHFRCRPASIASRTNKNRMFSSLRKSTLRACITRTARQKNRAAKRGKESKQRSSESWPRNGHDHKRSAVTSDRRHAPQTSSIAPPDTSVPQILGLPRNLTRTGYTSEMSKFAGIECPRGIYVQPRNRLPTRVDGSRNLGVP